MRVALGLVKSVVTNGQGYYFKTENGALSVTVINEDVVLFDYLIDGYTVSKKMEDVSRMLFGAEDQSERHLVERCLVESAENWVVRFGNSEVRVDKADSTISVIRDEKLVFGGRAGGADTVIPQTQFRLLGTWYERNIAKGQSEVIGRFDFAINDGDSFFGLGDKAGIPDHRGKRLRMYNKDAIGYDARFSDPLYKSIPLIIKHNIGAGDVGVYLPVPCIQAVDLGKESPFYAQIDVLGGPFRFAVILGRGYKDILGRYYEITGRPMLPPLFSFGYLGSSMNYVEAWDAQWRIEQFFADVEARNLPCEGMYVSSGYLKSDDGLRHAFMWNKRKFPNPEAFIRNLQGRGYHLMFNIKPGILKTHPMYEKLLNDGLFIKDDDGNTIVEYFWGGQASFIDFLNPKAVDWWKEQLNKAYLDYGAEGIWNDNNEFEMEDSTLEAYKIRTIYPVEMAKVAYQACLKKNPDKRPWVYSRSGYAGMQKYARTWTGDNTSTFETLKFNQFQGASLALSGVPFVGHDLGGFFGPEPSAELMVRCCQSAVFQSRFVIHSWRENDQPTEPWKFSMAYNAIKASIFAHYAHIPYIYDQAYKATSGAPLERLLCLEYPDDNNLSPQTEAFMFGDSVLKAPVLREGQRTKNVVFPQGDNWYSPKLGRLFRGGQCVDFDAPLDVFWYFYKVGSVIPISLKIAKLETGYFPKLCMFIVPKDGYFSFDYFEDDGVSTVTEKSHNIWTLDVKYCKDTGCGQVTVRLSHLGDKKSLKGRTTRVSFPKGFEGDVEVETEKLDGVVVPFSGHFLENF